MDNNHHCFKCLRSILVVFLCLGMMITSLVLPVKARTIDHSYETSNYDNTKKFDEKDIEFEITEEREEYAKHFHMNDGSNTAVEYEHAVFYYENGEYVEIDNQLKKTEEGYRNSNNERWNVSLFNNGEYHLSFDGINLGFSDAYDKAVTEYIELEDDKDSLLFNKSVSDVVRYKDILKDIDVDYQLFGGGGVKENIILKSEQASNRIEYTLTAEGYEVYEKEGQIVFSRNGVEEYSLSAPYAIDSNDRSTGEITLSLKDSNTIILEISQEWLSTAQYPVIIDPVITRVMERGSVRSTTVYSKKPNSNAMYSYGAMYVGRQSTDWLNCRGAFKFTLPTLDESDMVIQASFSLNQRNYSGSGNNVVKVAQIDQDLPINTLTWNILDGHFGHIREFVITSSGTNNEWFEFDITGIVRDWYLNDNNYGLALISSAEDTAYRYASFVTTNHPTYTSRWPYATVRYISKDGLEDYLSYETVDSLILGQFNVGHFNGNLIYLHEDFSDSGNWLPVSVSHVYNHHKRAVDETVNSSMKFGKGFRLSVSLQVRYDSDNDWYELYDEDGTVHYFINDEGTYKEEFNDSNVLEVNSNDYTIDNDSSKTVFDKTTGLISYVEDKINNKTQSFTYNNASQLIKITDGAGRETLFTYTNSYLTKIAYDIETDSSSPDYGQGREITYTYNSNGQLSSVTMPDGNIINYSYTSTGELQSVSNTHEGRIEIEYLDGLLKRVESITRYGNDNTLGESVSFDYANNETTITDDEGYELTYLFDEAGHTVSVRDNENNGVYGGYVNTSDNNKHSLSFESEMQTTTVNLLKNHTPTSTSNYTGTFTLVTTGDSDSFYSSKAFKITNNNSVSQSVSVTSGKTYTASAYVKITSGTDYKVYLGNSDKQGKLNEWMRISETFTASSNSYTFTISGYGTGEALIKNFQLEEGAVASRYNLIENGSFEDSVTNWNIVLVGSDDGVVTGRNGSGYQITSTASKKRRIYQEIEISGNQGDEFILSLWGKNDTTTQKELNEASANTGNSQGRAIGARITFIDENDTEITTDSLIFESASFSWQYMSGSFSAPENYKAVRVYLFSKYCYGTTVYDDVQLYLQPFGTTYEYDSEGREIRSQDAQGNIIITAYKDITITTTDGNETTDVVDYIEYRRASEPTYHKETVYDYDANGNVISEIYTDYNLEQNNPNRVTTILYNYDDDNNLISTETNGELHYESGEVGYSDNFIDSYTDERGKVTTYLFDEVTGHLLSLTDPRGNTTSYTYLANSDLVSSVSSGNSSVNYSYNDLGQISTITHSNTSSTSTQYSFDYDCFGNLVEVSVGSRVLYSYEYESHNGKLSSATNGNNEEMSYQYDSLGRVTEIYRGNTLAYSFEYGSDGKLGRFTDHLYNETETYEYDFSGNVIRESRSDGTRLFNDYDDNGKIISSGYSKLTNSSITSFTYNPKQEVETVSWNTNNLVSSLTYSRDVLGRHIGSAYSINSVDILGTNVTYVLYRDNNNEEKTTSFIDEVTNAFGTDVLNYEYGYDNNGNITSVDVYNGVTHYVYTYQYDSLNQLIRENDPVLNKTIVYSYDSGGNRTSVSVYSYTTADNPSNPLSTETYGYTDSNWKDLLTSYNNNSITYDSTGHPLVYHDGKQFTWSYGRLTSYADTANNRVVSYTYDSEGIRTSKSVNGVTAAYLLSGSTILQETKGSDAIIYEYDDNGSLRSFVYNGDRYVYVKNGTEDIVGILNSSGDLVAKYDYDGYGNCTVTNIGNSTIGDTNPFRYRSYYYDSESGFYYLNARYYDPQIGRFISPDEVECLGASNTVQSYNLFTYCENNPVNDIDFTGNWSIKIIVTAALTSAVISAVSTIIYNVAHHIKWYKGVASSSIGSAVNTALSMALPIKGVSGVARNAVAALGGSVAQAVVDFVINKYVYKEFTWKKLTMSFLSNSISSYFGGLLGATVFKTNDGWFQAKYIKSFLTKSYGKKLMKQMGIGEIINFFARKMGKWFGL